MKSMSKKEPKKTQVPPQALQPEKENFITMFSRLDSKSKHRILAYLVCLFGIFIILFAYRAS